MAARSGSLPPDGESFAANQAFLRRLARGLVSDPGRAEDLVQDTWLRWVEKAPGDVRAPRSWLARALRWRASNERRERQRRELRERAVAREPGVPEGPGDATEDMLAVQAQVVAALRTLPEPVRSTLVQRYFHDKSPRRIAAEAGLPLDTVKARLRRGLQRLREDLDRRHGGRATWCHLLWSVAGRSGPWSLTGSLTALVAAVARLGVRAFGAGTSLGAWLALAGVLAGAFFLWARWPRGEFVPLAAARPPAEPGRAGTELRDVTRVPLARQVDVPPATGALPAPAPASAPAPPVLVLEPMPFTWAQFCGAPAHDPGPLRDRGDLVGHPAVLWSAAGFTGQPGLREGRLFAGGMLLQQLDLATGRAFPAAPAVKRLAGHRPDRAAREALLRRFGVGDLGRAGFGAAPIVTEERVLVRVLSDGGVAAFDRDLEAELWRFRPEPPREAFSPPLLISDLVVAALGHELVALHVHDGSVAWRHALPEGESVDATPAALEGLLCFGSDQGLVVGLDWSSGESIWSTRVQGDLGEAAAVLDGQRVFLAGPLPGALAAQARLWAFDLSGAPLWDSGALLASPVSIPGPGAGAVHVAAGNGVFALDAASGQRLWERGDPGATLAPRRRAAERPTPPQPSVVGTSLYSVDLAGELQVLDAASGVLRWRLRAEGSRVIDLVHAGDRLYVVTEQAIFAIGNDPRGPAAEPDLDFELATEARIARLRRELEPGEALERDIAQLRAWVRERR